MTAAGARGLILVLGRIALRAFEGRIALSTLIHRDDVTGYCCFVVRSLWAEKRKFNYKRWKKNLANRAGTN